MKILELILDEENEEMGVYAISVVNDPAIGENFVKLSNQQITFSAIDKEKNY